MMLAGYKFYACTLLQSANLEHVKCADKRCCNFTAQPLIPHTVTINLLTRRRHVKVSWCHHTSLCITAAALWVWHHCSTSQILISSTIIHSSYYIHRPWVDEIKFLPFYTCDERWALHIVIKRKVFTFIFAVFLQYFMLFLLVTPV